MATTNHVGVDRNHSNGLTYPDENEQFGYGSMFQNAPSSSENYDQSSWALDPSLTAHGTSEHAVFAATQGWHHNQNPQPQHHTASGNVPLYGDGSAAFGSTYGAAQNQYQPGPSSFIGDTQYQSFSNSALDPSLVTNTSQHGSNSFQGTRHFFPSTSQQTIAPAALQNVSLQPKSSASPSNGDIGTLQASGSYVAIASQRPTNFEVGLPKSTKAGSFSVVTPDLLNSVTKAQALNDFCCIGLSVQNFNSSKVANIPTYIPRRSQNDFKLAVTNDTKLIGNLTKKQAKAIKSKAVKIPRPRLPLVRTESQSQASTPSSVQSSSSDDESEYSGSEDELDIIEKSPLPTVRPSEPLEATKYDTIKAVWLPSRKYPTSDQIRAGLKDVWEVLGTLRDRWKSDGDALKAATEKKKEKELPMLKERVKGQRDMLDVALLATLEHGHSEILSRLGEIRPFLQMCNVFLVDRARDTDFDGTLTKHFLELLSKCTTVTADLLDNYKLKKTMSIYAKRGNEATRSLVKKIDENAAAASKAKADKAKDAPLSANAGNEKTAETKSDVADKTATTKPSSVLGVKRALPTDSANAASVKRVASGSNPPAVKSANPSTLPKRSSPAGAAKPALVNKIAVSAVKPKATATTKTPSLFAGLQSASKKPGTSNVAIAASKKAATVSGEKDTSAAVQTVTKPSSGFNFGEYMADLNKPKEPEPSKIAKKDDKPPETEEQKRKRLRKEARRHLRVKFREGSSLFEIREFHHHPEEETGHDENMVRDVGNVTSEGLMFKQHKDQLDIEEDDEVLIAHKTPSLIDFATLPEEARTGETRNYIKFGGPQEADSDEREVQDKHGTDTLFVYYSDTSEIPPCPREPVDPYTGDTSAEVRDFGAPDDAVMGRANALQQPSGPKTPAPPNPTDISAILKAIGNINPQSQQPMPVPNPLAGLQNLIPAQSTPVPQAVSIAPPPTPMAPTMPPVTQDLSSILASLQNHAMPATAQPTPPVPHATPSIPPMPPFPMLPNVSGGGMPDLQQIMSMMQQFPGMLPPPPAGFVPPPHMMQHQASADGPGLNGNAGSPAPFENPDRLKRMREADDEPMDQPPQQKWGQQPKKRVWLGERPKFVKPCIFWQQGRCLKGADCTFLHEARPED